MEKTVLVPLAQGSEEMEAVTIVDMLRRAGINVKTAGENEIITCSRGVKIIPDILIEQISATRLFDAVILPGGVNGTKNLSDNSQLIKILRHHLDQERLIAAICAAPIILADNDLLDKNQSITSHPSVKSQLQTYKYSENPVVEDGNIVTSRGAGTALQFSLKIIEILVDKVTAIKVSEGIVLNNV